MRIFFLKEDIPEERGTDREKYGLSKSTCSGCWTLYGEYLELDTDNQIINLDYIYDFNGFRDILCYNLAESDKNWITWEHKKIPYISYSLVPQHIVFTGVYPFHNCTAKLVKTNSIFYRLSEYYNNIIIFSLSTTAISAGNIKIAVGHAKILLDEIDKIPEDTPLYTFVSSLKGWITTAHKLIYTMFIYTFDPETLNINGLSPIFIPPKSHTAVIYPCGLSHTSEDWLISYGDGDSRAKILFIPHSQVNDMIIPVEKINPETHQFIVYN